MDPNVVMKAYGKINKYNDKYVSNNAKTKEVELYGQNSLKINNNTNPKNNPSGKGKGGGANPQYPGSNNQPKQRKLTLSISTQISTNYYLLSSTLSIPTKKSS